MSVLPLHPYQTEAVEAVRRELDAGRTRPLVVAPTGSGKTWILAELVAHFLAQGQRALLVVHREELVDQLAERVRLTVPDAWLGIEQAGRRADPLSRVVVGSVPTLAPRGSRRLDRLGRFDVVFCDESHHAPAASYQALFRRLGCFTPGGPPLIGCTATPRRGDGVGLGHIFQSIAVDIPLPRLITDGYLCPLRGFSVETTTALDHVRRRAGDFDEDQLSEAVNTPARNALAVRAYQAHAAGHQAVVFCVDRRHVHDMNGAFLASGLAAAPLTGDLPHKVRAERLDAFRRGILRVLVNCGVLVEGMDVPPLSAAVLSRPTASPLLFAQMVGRILRTYPGKEFAVAVDLVDNARAHSLQTLATLAGLPPKIRFQGERLFEVAPRLERMLTIKPWLATAIEADRLVTVEDILEASHPVDLLYLELPLPEAFQRSRLAWVAVPPARWLLSTREGTLTVRQTLLAYEVSWRERGEGELAVGASPTLEEAVTLAERAARTRLDPATLRMLDRRAPWRQRPATDGQKAKLDRYRIPYTDATTAGEASLALSRRFAGLTDPTLARHLGRQAAKEEAIRQSTNR